MGVGVGGGVPFDGTAQSAQNIEGQREETRERRRAIALLKRSPSVLTLFARPAPRGNVYSSVWSVASP